MKSTTQDGRFTINQTTGQITTAAGIDWEATGSSRSYTVLVRDTTANPRVASANVTISINDVNEAPTITAGPVFSGAENAVGAGKTLVGSVAVGAPVTEGTNRNPVHLIPGGKIR